MRMRLDSVEGSSTNILADQYGNAPNPAKGRNMDEEMLGDNSNFNTNGGETKKPAFNRMTNEEADPNMDGASVDARKLKR